MGIDGIYGKKRIETTRSNFLRRLSGIGIFAEDAITFESNKTRDKFMRNLNIPVKKASEKKADPAPKGK